MERSEIRDLGRQRFPHFASPYAGYIMAALRDKTSAHETEMLIT